METCERKCGQTRPSKIEIVGDGTAIVHLTQGKVAVIDESDIPKVAGVRWHYVKSYNTGYAKCNIKLHDGGFRCMPMHRVIAGLPGRWVKPFSIDHINGDSLDNRRCNLRTANYTIQKLNQRTRKDNTSGTSGVHLRPWGKYQARIAVGGKRFSLGHYETAEQADLVVTAVRDIVDYMLSIVVPPLNPISEVAI